MVKAAGKAKEHQDKKKSAGAHPAQKSQPRESSFELEFSANEFPHYPRNEYWYIGIGLLAIGTLSWAIWRGDWLVMLLVLAGTAAVFRLASEAPKSHRVSISQKGVSWGDKLYPFHLFRSFWLAEMGGRINLYLERLNFSTDLRVIIPENRTEEVFVYLQSFLPWHPHRRTPFGDKLGHWLKF